MPPVAVLFRLLGMFQENRIEPREAVALPLTLGDGSAAVTRDLSASGLYFETAQPNRVGERLAFEMDVPASGLRFRAEGQVVRVDACGDGAGVAVRLIDPRLEALE